MQRASGSVVWCRLVKRDRAFAKSSALQSRERDWKELSVCCYFSSFWPPPSSTALRGWTVFAKTIAVSARSGLLSWGIDRRARSDLHGVITYYLNYSNSPQLSRRCFFLYLPCAFQFSSISFSIVAGSWTIRPRRLTCKWIYFIQIVSAVSCSRRTASRLSVIRWISHRMRFSSRVPHCTVVDVIRRSE